MHCQPADDHRQADAAGAAAHTRVRRDATAEKGDADRQQAGEIAHHAVDDEAGDALTLGHERDVVADHCRVGEAFRRRDDDVAGFGNRKRAEDGEVVVRAGLAGDCEPKNCRAIGIERLDCSIETAASIHGVDGLAGLYALQPGELGGGRALPGFLDGE